MEGRWTTRAHNPSRTFISQDSYLGTGMVRAASRRETTTEASSMLPLVGSNSTHNEKQRELSKRF